MPRGSTRFFAGLTSSAEETLQGEPSSKLFVYAMTEFNVAMLLLTDGNGVNTAPEIETTGDKENTNSRRRFISSFLRSSC